MKKSNYLFIILAFSLLITNAHGQKPSITLTFTAQYHGEYVLLESIYVENLTQGGDTTIYAPNTTLVLNYSLGIADMAGEGKNALTISKNRPNPFIEQTSISIFMPEADHLQLSVTNLLGQKVASYENSLAAGNHSFAFNPGADKYYILSATANCMVRAIKMVSLSNHSQKTGSLVYQGSEEIRVDHKSTLDINDFGYSLGDELRFTGYANTSPNINGSGWILDTPGADETYLFEIMTGVPCSGEPYVTDIDGNIYNAVQIGGRCWMKENLKTTTYNNGTPIPNVTDPGGWGNLTSGAYVWYDNDISWKDKYGALYNWFTTVDLNGLCPTGWHVPTNDE